MSTLDFVPMFHYLDEMVFLLELTESFQVRFEDLFFYDFGPFRDFHLSHYLGFFSI